jgi:carboxylesterase type B
VIYDVSEDCLTVAVVRPSGYSHQKLPVGFWIHGGGFVNGGNADQRYNLSFIVERSVKIGKPIMAVAVNYRLSAWGFLGGDQVFGEGLANIGLRDQRLALHWVQENIAAFGGE